jgi:hypothetical protein
LRGICGNPQHPEEITDHGIALQVRGPLWLAPVFESGFGMLFEFARKLDCIEGVVLKNPNARLEPGRREDNNTRWQVKIRKPTAVYRF